MNAAAKPRILLVDDSLLMRKAAAKMLGEEFDVVTATDGEDGWERLQADTTIQVVFTDLSMPKMDGYALLQTIRAAEDEGTLNMPVIVVTGAENDEAARKKALDLGATDFITKPFGSVDLLARARAHANYRRIARKLEQQITLDALTGLANKAGYLERLQQDMAFARRLDRPLTLVRIDIDDFRGLFLKHGKAGAEALVQYVAQVLRRTLREEDSAARVGLASFALALPAGQHEGSKGLIERLRAQLAMSLDGDGGAPLPHTISAAVLTPALHESVTAAAALETCDRLLATALQAGGNRVVGASAESDAAAAPIATRTPPAPEPRSALPAATEPASIVSTPVAPAPSPAPPPAGAAPATRAAASPVATTMALDDAVQRIERGAGDTVLPHLPLLIRRLLPLLRLLSPQQRAQLAAHLQKPAG